MNDQEQPDPLEVRRRVRQVLARMELVSYGSTYGYNSSGGDRGESTRAMPHGELSPLHLEWRERFAVPMGDERCRQLLDEAEDALDRVIKGPRAKGTMSDEDILKARILDQGKDWDAKEVARVCSCLPSYVIAVREAAKNKGAEDHVRIVGGTSRKARAITLREQGLTQAAIAERMGMSQKSVSRLLAENDPLRRAA